MAPAASTTTAAVHDDGTKTFLGQTGNFSGSDIVNIIFQQPAASKLFATKLLSFFVYMDPEPQLVNQVAALIMKNNFEMKPVMSTLLRSNVFFSDRSYRALVKSPVEFVVGTHQLFGIPEVAPIELATLRAMGQVLFYPPNVKGWDGGEAWLSSSTILTRENFANAMAQNPKMMQGADWIASAMRAMDPRSVAKLAHRHHAARRRVAGIDGAARRIPRRRRPVGARGAFARER